MKLKKMLSLLLCAILCVSLLTACGGGEKASSADVEFWNDKLGGNTEKKVLDGLTSSIKKASDVKIKIVGYPDVASYQTSLQQSVKTPSSPGMFTWWSGPQLESLVKGGVVSDLTEEWEKYYIPAGVSQDIADAFTIDGKIYAAPYSVLYNVTYYNKNAFAKAGIEKAPETFDEFISACGQLLEAGITPIGIKNDAWAGFIWFQQLIAAHDPQLYLDLCDGTKPYTDAEIVKVMEKWREMLDKGYFASPVQYDDMFKAFSKGETAMILEPNTLVTSLQKEYGMESGKDFDVFALPSMNGGKASVFFEASPICISEASDKKDKALEAMRGFYDPEVQKIMCEDLGIANTSTVELKDDTLKKIVDYSTKPDEYVLMLRFYENTPSDLRDVVLDELSRFIISGASPKDVLEVAQKEADKAFK